MKCTSKKEYECLYLDKNNIDEFVKWFKAKINNNVVSYKYDEDDNDYCYVVIAINDEYCEGDVDLYYDVNRWYVLKNGDLFDYSCEMFREMYAVEEGVVY